MSLSTRVLTGIVWVVGASLLGCGGLSDGEKEPGQETQIATGDIAVDDRTDTIFLLSSGSAFASDPSLLAVNPDTGTSKSVLDLNGRTSEHVYFPNGGVLVVSASQDDGSERFDLLDKDTLTLKNTLDSTAADWEFKLSPGREHLSGLDSKRALVIVLDATTLIPKVLELGGSNSSAAWESQHDELIALSMDDETTTHIRSWQVESAGAIPRAKLHFDLTVSGVTPENPNTPIAVSPDDSRAAFSVLDSTGTPSLLVMDLKSGKTSLVPNALGPVGFTPDGSSIVSYRNTDDTDDEELLIINAATLDVDPITVPLDGSLTYLVSHDGNDVLVVPSFGGGVVMVDTSTQTQSTLAARSVDVGLQEVVSRKGTGEMWLVESPSLFRVDTNVGTFANVPVDIVPSHINILPNHDRLVLDDDLTGNIVLFNPITKSIEKTIALPGNGN